jgi:hypothetical protein
MTSLGFELAAFLLAAQCLNQLRYIVPKYFVIRWKYFRASVCDSAVQF